MHRDCKVDSHLGCVLPRLGHLPDDTIVCGDDRGGLHPDSDTQGETAGCDLYVPDVSAAVLLDWDVLYGEEGEEG
jgi:hypothetical protein